MSFGAVISLEYIYWYSVCALSSILEGLWSLLKGKNQSAAAMLFVGLPKWIAENEFELARAESVCWCWNWFGKQEWVAKANIGTVNSAMWIYIFGKLVLTLSGVLCLKPTNTMRSGSQARKADNENNPAQINLNFILLGCNIYLQ
jgi:hypothetical protein